VADLLSQDLSPDQVAKVLKAENGGVGVVSHERIYRWIYDHPARQLGLKLRHRRHRRKPWRRGVKAGVIKHRRDIAERPAIVETRSRVGDWEADTVVGAGQAGAMLTLTERATGVILTHALPRKAAEAVRVAMIYLLGPLKAFVKTITSDNGTEFARHQEIAAALEADFYFAQPHSPWQHGSNENGNGLLRQYFPKGMRLDAVPAADVHHAMQRLNTRPRKRFGYASPLQMFERLTGITQAHDLMRIALQA
jgi:IS30 family transposase